MYLGGMKTLPLRFRALSDTLADKILAVTREAILTCILAPSPPQASQKRDVSDGGWPWFQAQEAARRAAEQDQQAIRPVVKASPVITGTVGDFTLVLPNGKRYHSTRRRDLTRRARQHGYAI